MCVVVNGVSKRCKNTKQRRSRVFVLLFATMQRSLQDGVSGQTCACQRTCIFVSECENLKTKNTQFPVCERVIKFCSCRKISCKVFVSLEIFCVMCQNQI